MLPWFVQQWNDVKGNVKYAALYAGILALGTVIMGAVSALTHGLTAWQQAGLVGLFAALFGIAIFGIAIARRERKQSQGVQLMPEPEPRLLPAHLEVGRLVATVYDGAGIFISGAAITARNDETDRVYLGTTGEYGETQIRVPPGMYTVTARYQGFYKAANAAKVRREKNDCVGHTQFILQRELKLNAEET